MLRYYQLIDLCSRIDTDIKKYFRGVFSLDTVPDSISMIDPNKPNFLIFNTEPSTKPGAHWVGAFIDLQSDIVFIDSYDQSPHYYDLEDFFLEATGGDYITIGKKLQSDFTNVCAIYVLFFGHYLSKGYDLKKIIDLIPDHTNVLKDRHMVEWFNKNYGKSIKLNNPFIDCNKFRHYSGYKQSCKSYEKMIFDRKSI